MRICIRINRWEVRYTSSSRRPYDGFYPAWWGGARIDCTTEPEHYYFWWFGNLTLRHHDFAYSSYRKR